MKKLLSLVCAIMLIIVMAGCDPKPEVVPEVVVDPDINCNGYFTVQYNEWGCEYAAGTYWVNKEDGRYFLLGEAQGDVAEVFGRCPDSYISELIFEEE